jgi:exoribonuclease R
LPMLPEALSNGLCSLNPHVDRLCMVCDLKLSRAGKVTGYEFYPAVMHSKARLTYTQVGRYYTGFTDPDYGAFASASCAYAISRSSNTRRYLICNS